MPDVKIPDLLIIEIDVPALDISHMQQKELNVSITSRKGMHNMCTLRM